MSKELDKGVDAGKESPKDGVAAENTPSNVQGKEHLPSKVAEATGDGNDDCRPDPPDQERAKETVDLTKPASMTDEATVPPGSLDTTTRSILSRDPSAELPDLEEDPVDMNKTSSNEAESKTNVTANGSFPADESSSLKPSVPGLDQEDYPESLMIEQEVTTGDPNASLLEENIKALAPATPEKHISDDVPSGTTSPVQTDASEATSMNDAQQNVVTETQTPNEFASPIREMLLPTNNGQPHFMPTPNPIELQQSPFMQHQYNGNTFDAMTTYSNAQNQSPSANPDAIEMLPPVDAYQQQQQRQRVFLRQPMMNQESFYSQSGGRRKIRLRLQQDVREQRQGFLGHFRQRSRSIIGLQDVQEQERFLDRGILSVSWYEGTSSLELQEHVRKSTVRKLKLESYISLVDIRFVDITTDPPEEIVLSPCIPSGSVFVLQFALHDTRQDGGFITPAPESPSAAPSPHPSRARGLDAKQIAALKMPDARNHDHEKLATASIQHTEQPEVADEDHNDQKDDNDDSENELVPAQVQDPIEARLNQIAELLLSDRVARRQQDGYRRREKTQVIFVLANYFVLFLSLIAISAEIQARAPNWLNSLEQQMRDVQDCASDKEALFQCVTNGDFAGLIASVMIWLTRSVATRRIFLFGFETSYKLWTAVYESFVTAFCWGFSYLFIRRAMNPATRPRFLHKYWKDAVYGSLAGFNAAFLKHVLKNLIPQEAVEDVLRERQLKILSWLPSFE